MPTNLPTFEAIRALRDRLGFRLVPGHWFSDWNDDGQPCRGCVLTLIANSKGVRFSERRPWNVADEAAKIGLTAQQWGGIFDGFDGHKCSEYDDPDAYALGQRCRELIEGDG